MTNSISRVEALKSEATNAGDTEQVALCERAEGHALHDSDTTKGLTPEELFPVSDFPMVDYVAAIIESLDCSQAEGHISVGGRRVYAD